MNEKFPHRDVHTNKTYIILTEIFLTTPIRLFNHLRRFRFANCYQTWWPTTGLGISALKREKQQVEAHFTCLRFI